MSIERLCVALLLLALAAGVPVREARAGDAFSAQSVFARPEASSIDDRCTDAREFARRAGKDAADVDAYAAVAGEHAFLACFYMKRLNPDVDDLRYLVLAAATAAYMGATQAERSSAVVLFHQADDLAAVLGAEAPDRPWTLVEQRMGSLKDRAGNTGQGGSSSGPVHYVELLKPDAFGKSHAMRFADVATQLRAAITKSLAAELAPGPSPTP
jgi:hypothetical protein